MSYINEHAMLKMLFLANHHCTVNFNLPIVQIGGRSLKCNDKEQRKLISNIQAQRQSESAVAGKLITQNLYFLELVEA